MSRKPPTRGETVGAAFGCLAAVFVPSYFIWYGVTNWSDGPAPGAVLLGVALVVMVAYCLQRSWESRQ